MELSAFSYTGHENLLLSVWKSWKFYRPQFRSCDFLNTDMALIRPISHWLKVGFSKKIQECMELSANLHTYQPNLGLPVRKSWKFHRPQFRSYDFLNTDMHSCPQFLTNWKFQFSTKNHGVNGIKRNFAHFSTKPSSVSMKKFEILPAPFYELCLIF